jgi:two-component system, cell cycle response regulator
MTRVLVVANRFDRARHLERILVGSSYETAIATRVEDALASIRLSLCDLVVLDADGPAEDMFACCRTIRTDHVPVLMLTDKARPWQRLLALDAGADECLAVPFHDDALLARVRSLAELKSLTDDVRRSATLRGVPAGFALGAPDGSRTARILVLDPDPRSRVRLVEILSAAYSVDAAAHPERWFEAAATSAYHVAVVSHDWPDADGSRYARQLRLSDPTRTLRIVLVADGDDLALRSWEGYADDVLSRPVDRSEALARVGVASRKVNMAAGLARTRTSGLVSFVPRISSFGRRQPPDRFAA